MKHQISKVALIAAFAFIGAGFAGTQQANAGTCPPVNCDSFICDEDQTEVLSTSAPGYYCKKCLGSCNAKKIYARLVTLRCKTTGATGTNTESVAGISAYGEDC